MNIDSIVEKIMKDDTVDHEKRYKEYYSFVQQPPAAKFRLTQHPFRIFHETDLAGKLAVCNTKVEMPAKTFVRFSRRETSGGHVESKVERTLDSESTSKFVPLGLMEDLKILKNKNRVFGQEKETWKLAKTKVEVQAHKPCGPVRPKTQSIIKVRFLRSQSIIEKSEPSPIIRTVHSREKERPKSQGRKKYGHLPTLNESSKESSPVMGIMIREPSISNRIKRAFTQKDKTPHFDQAIRNSSALHKNDTLEVRKTRPSAFGPILNKVDEEPFTPKRLATPDQKNLGFFKKIDKRSAARASALGQNTQSSKLNEQLLNRVKDILNIEGDSHTELIRNKIIEDIESDLYQLGNVAQIRSLVQSNSRRKLTIGETPLEMDMNQMSVNQNMLNLMGDDKEIENILQRVLGKMATMGIEPEEEDFGKRFLHEREELRKKDTMFSREQNSDEYSSCNMDSGYTSNDEV